VLAGTGFLMLGRSFYMLYVRRRGNRTSKVVTWLAAVFVVCFWIWRFSVSPSAPWG
jgi:hypothetical protein